MDFLWSACDMNIFKILPVGEILTSNQKLRKLFGNLEPLCTEDLYRFAVGTVITE